MARVLLVDNDPDGVEIRRLLLEREGHQAFSALNVEDARRKFRQTAPETVVLDLRIPHAADGFELIREFRAASPELRIIVLSGYPRDIQDRPEARMVNEIVPKPARPARLLELIAKPTVAEP